MTTVKLKADLHRYIDEVDDKNLLSALRNVLSSKRKNKKDFWEDLSGSERKEILKAIKELDKGESHSYEEFISSHRRKK